MGVGQDFERDIVKGLNAYFERTGTKAMAYRHLQTRYQPQIFDVFVDSSATPFYAAIECKRVDSDAADTLYFSSHFRRQKGVSQIQRETDWLNLSGRNGFLAVESWSPSLRKRSAFIVPWRVVDYHFQRGDPDIPQTIISNYTCVHRQGGKYTFDDDDIAGIIKECNAKGGRSHFKASKPRLPRTKKGDE